MVHLASALAGNMGAMLKRLELAGLGIGAKGGQALAQALVCCERLQHLDVSRNRRMGDVAMGDIITAVGGGHHGSLRHVDLCDNGGGQGMAKALLQSVESHHAWPSLVYLDVTGNNHMEEGILGKIGRVLRSSIAYPNLKHIALPTPGEVIPLSGGGGGAGVIDDEQSPAVDESKATETTMTTIGRYPAATTTRSSSFSSRCIIS